MKNNNIINPFSIQKRNFHSTTSLQNKPNFLEEVQKITKLNFDSINRTHETIKTIKDKNSEFKYKFSSLNIEPDVSYLGIKENPSIYKD
jgi:hypothetical protein